MATPMHPISQSGSISPYTLELAQIELQNPQSSRRLKTTPPWLLKRPIKKIFRKKNYNICIILDVSRSCFRIID